MMSLLLGSIFSYVLPDQASTVASDVDLLFIFIMRFSVFAFLFLMSCMLFFIIRYRRRSNSDLTSKVSYNRTLEIVWTIIPACLFVGIAIWGWRVFHTLNTPPRNAKEIKLIARQWSWEFSFDNENRTIRSMNNLHVPINKPIVLDMISADVVHSFFVPSFRVKKDVVPGVKTRVWFEATRTGKFSILCAELCGTGHSKMLGTVHVLSEPDYEVWLAKATKASEAPSLALQGKQIFEVKGCTTCHAIDGERGIGPALNGLWGKKREFADGSQLESADAAYIRESLMRPKAKVVKGFQPKMVPYQGLLTEQEITALVEYLKSLE